MKIRLLSLIRVHLRSGSEVDHDKKGDFISLLYFSRWAVVIKKKKRERERERGGGEDVEELGNTSTTQIS